MPQSQMAQSRLSYDLRFAGVEKFDVFEIIEKGGTSTVGDESTMTAQPAELPEAFFEYFVVQKAS